MKLNKGRRTPRSITGFQSNARYHNHTPTHHINMQDLRISRGGFYLQLTVITWFTGMKYEVSIWQCHYVRREMQICTLPSSQTLTVQTDTTRCHAPPPPRLSFFLVCPHLPPAGSRVNVAGIAQSCLTDQACDKQAYRRGTEDWLQRHDKWCCSCSAVWVLKEIPCCFFFLWMCFVCWGKVRQLLILLDVLVNKYTGNQCNIGAEETLQQCKTKRAWSLFIDHLSIFNLSRSTQLKSCSLTQRWLDSSTPPALASDNLPARPYVGDILKSAN